MKLFFVLHFLLGVLLGSALWSQMKARKEPDLVPAAFKTTSIAKLSSYVAIVFCLLTLWGDLIYFGLYFSSLATLLLGAGALLQIYLVPAKLKFVLTFIAIPLCIASLGVISRLWLLLESTLG